MAFIVSIAVGAIGAAIGTAIGAAIGGTILGISIATIGGVIGAGIAGGILSSVRGGSFGEGFLKGAVGGIIGSFASSAFGAAGGAATQAADGTTTAGMLAAQGGAEFAPDALSGLGDLGSTGAVSGLGEIGGAGGVETFALDQMAAPVGTPIDAAGNVIGNGSGFDVGLSDTINNSAMGFDPATQGNMSLSQGNLTAPQATSGFNTEPTSLGNQFNSAPDTAASGGDYGGAAAPTAPGSSLENIGASQQPVAPTEGVAASTGQEGFGGGVKKMFNTSDEWLKNTLGKGAPSTGKLLLGGAQYLMDRYNISKQQRQAQGLAPMSFEEYSQNYTDPGAYRNASENMARGGRTGTLPLLLARLKNDTRGKYAGYLPGAKREYYDVQQGVQANKNASLSRLFNGIGYGT